MIDKLEAIKMTFDLLDEEVPEKTLVARALVVAPKQYGAALVAKKRQKGDKLSLEDVQSCMADMYAITYGPAVMHKANKDSGDREVSLSNVSSGNGGGKRFGGTCFCCKKRGHKASECRSNPVVTGTSSNTNQASSSSNECGFCGKTGHDKGKCWLKPANKVPDFAVRRLQQMANNKSKGVQNASVAKDDGGKEINCCQVTEEKIEFDKTIELLKDPNVWIADSGSSSHSTGHGFGMIDLDSKMPGGALVTSSGHEMVPTQKGKLPVTISVGGRMRHVHVQQLYLRDLKEDGLVRVKWIPTEENSVDVFTKNLFGPLYEKQIKTYVGTDQYMQYEGNDWTLVAQQKKKRKQASGHGSSRGNGPSF
jgi:hypothetical protein